MIVDQRLCACGSGLRAARCCAMDFSLVPPPEASRPLLPVVERAAELHRQGAITEAERLCLEVLELAPAQPDALTLLYQVRNAGGAERAARRCCSASWRCTRTRSGRPASSPSRCSTRAPSCR